METDVIIIFTSPISGGNVMVIVIWLSVYTQYILLWKLSVLLFFPQKTLTTHFQHTHTFIMHYTNTFHPPTHAIKKWSHQ